MITIALISPSSCLHLFHYVSFLSKTKQSFLYFNLIMTISYIATLVLYFSSEPLLEEGGRGVGGEGEEEEL